MIAPVNAALAALLVDDEVGLGARTMVVQIGIEVGGIEVLEGLGVGLVDVAVAHVLADHGAVFGFDQAVIVAVPGPAFGLLDEQVVEQAGDDGIDIFAAVVGVKA